MIAYALGVGRAKNFQLQAEPEGHWAIPSQAFYKLFCVILTKQRAKEPSQNWAESWFLFSNELSFRAELPSRASKPNPSKAWLGPTPIMH